MHFVHSRGCKADAVPSQPKYDLQSGGSTPQIENKNPNSKPTRKVEIDPISSTRYFVRKHLQQRGSTTGFVRDLSALCCAIISWCCLKDLGLIGKSRSSNHTGHHTELDWTPYCSRRACCLLAAVGLPSSNSFHVVFFFHFLPSSQHYQTLVFNPLPILRHHIYNIQNGSHFLRWR